MFTYAVIGGRRLNERSVCRNIGKGDTEVFEECINVNICWYRYLMAAQPGIL
jgi:hypothetical protein